MDDEQTQAARFVCERLWLELHEAWETDDDIEGGDTVQLICDLRELITLGAGEEASK